MLSISRENLDHANMIYPISGKRFNEETDKRLATFKETMACVEVLTSEGRKTKKKIFLDGILVDIQSLSFSEGKVTIRKGEEGGAGEVLRSNRAREMLEKKKEAEEQQLASAKTAPHSPIISIPSFNAGSPLDWRNRSGSEDGENGRLKSMVGGGIGPLIKKMASSPILGGSNGNESEGGSDGSGSVTPGLQRQNSFKTRRTSLDGDSIAAVAAASPSNSSSRDRKDSRAAGAKSPLALVEVVDETSWDLLRRGIIIPTLPSKMKWDMFVGALIVFSVIVVPFRLGFDMAPTPKR